MLRPSSVASSNEASPRVSNASDVDPSGGEPSTAAQRVSGEESKSRSSSVRLKGEKKQNRVSLLLERLNPRSSVLASARNAGESSEDFVISEPSSFAHRAHGETGLAALLHSPGAASASEVQLRRAFALYSFTPKFENEISLEAGELVLCFVDQEEDDWWKGVNTKKQWGWFPRNLIHLSEE